MCALCATVHRVPDGTPPLCISKSLMIAKPQGENKSKLSRELLPRRLQWGALRPPRAVLPGGRHRPQNAHTSFFNKQKYPNIETVTPFLLAPLQSLFSPTARGPRTRGRGRQSCPSPADRRDVTALPQPGGGSETYCSLRCRSGSPSVLFPQRPPSPAVPRASVGCRPCAAPR